MTNGLRDRSPAQHHHAGALYRTLIPWAHHGRLVPRAGCGLLAVWLASTGLDLVCVAASGCILAAWLFMCPYGGSKACAEVCLVCHLCASLAGPACP